MSISKRPITPDAGPPHSAGTPLPDSRPQGERASDVLLLKVACPDCGHPHDYAELGSQIRCTRCGFDYRAQADGDNASRILSVTPDELENVPYSQRSIEVPVNKVSSVFVADPTLLSDKLLRDAPLKENCKWIGKVRLLKKLGQGGMGAVYRGYDESLALDVAVKILPVSLEERDTQFVERFRQEARISAKINHPNVVRTLHVDEHGELLYLVMDYIEGRTARQLVQDKGPLPLPQALQIILDAAKGMQAAHVNSVIHRDIKPDNILVADDGRVLLTDLGLAKAASSGSGSPMPVTRMGLLLGTPQYMSPEQWDIGAKIGPSSDIWSIGATLWMLLTGKPPFDESDLSLLARQIKEIPIPNVRSIRPELPEIANNLLQRCLAKRADERFACAADLIAAIEDTLDALRTGRDVLPLPKVIQEQIAKQQELERERQAKQQAVERALAEQAQKAAQAALSIPGVIAPATPQEPPRVVIMEQPAQPSRKWLWGGLAAASVAIAAGVLLTRPPERPDAPAIVAPALSLELRCPKRVRPGESADMNAVIAGVPNPDDFVVLWTAGERAFNGSSVQVPLAHDTDFVVTVRDKATTKELVRRSIQVQVDLQVRAAEQDVVSIETGSVLHLSGEVKGGGAADQIETRWVEASTPSVAISADRELVQPNLDVGRYTYILQARRRDQDGWTNAATDKVSVEVKRRIPEGFRVALQKGLEESKRAAEAKTGAEAVEAWKRAIDNFEQAQKAFADSDEPKTEADHCRRQLGMDERYVALLEEGRKLREAAEAVPESDGVRRLSAWSDALQPYTAALALFEREEARGPATELGKRVADLKATLESAEKERGTFDSMITKARVSAREAKKYVKASVALPYWEDALTGFQELARRFPRRSEEFALELREVQENRDKAYLYDQFGVVPAKLPERFQEVPKKPASQGTMPARKLPEPGKK